MSEIINIESNAEKQITQLGISDISSFMEVKKANGLIKYYANAFDTSFELTEEQYCKAMMGKLKFIQIAVEVPNEEVKKESEFQEPLVINESLEEFIGE